MNLKYADTFEALPLLTRSSTVTGAAVNIKDFHGSLVLTLMSEAASTGDTLDAKVQHSVNGSTAWADITGAVWTQVTAAADAHESISIDANAARGFIRIVGTLAGGSISFAFGVSGIGYKQTQAIQQ